MDRRLQSERWIFVEDSPFLPAHGGGMLEHLGMLRAASKLGLLALVVLPCEGRLDLAPYRSELGEVPIITVARRTSPLLLLHPREPFVTASRPVAENLVEEARGMAPGATGILISSYKSWRIGAALAQGLGLPAVLRMHNREGSYHASLAQGTSGPRGWALRREATRIERDERQLASAGWLAGTADISDDDAAWRRSVGPGAVVVVPPFAVDPDSPAPRRDPQFPPRVLFLGALNVATNVVAVRWLLEEVWPLVRARHPEVVLDIVGRAPDREFAASIAEVDGVQLSVDVPTVEPFLSRAALAVNPAITGSGVNIKLIEYLHAGLPLVSTSLATRGLPLRVGHDLLLADEPGPFADAVMRLLDDPAAAARMGETGRASLLGMIDPERNLATIAELMHRR